MHSILSLPFDKARFAGLEPVCDDGGGGGTIFL